MPEVIQGEKKKRITYNPAAVAKYVRNNYDRIDLKVGKGRKARFKAIAKTQGESLNSFINTAIDERVERLGSPPAAVIDAEHRLSALDEFFKAVNASEEEVPETFERIKLREVVV